MDPDTHTEQNTPGTSGASPFPAVRGVEGEDRVLEVLREFEAGVESLKRLYTERTALTARLAELERALTMRAEQLGLVEHEIEAKRAMIAQADAEIIRRATAIDEREAALEGLERELQSRSSDMAAREIELAVQREACVQQAAEIEASATARTIELEERERVSAASSEAARAALEAAHQNVERVKASASIREAELAAALEASQRQMNAMREQVQSARASASSDAASANAAMSAAQQRANDAEARASILERAKAALEEKVSLQQRDSSGVNGELQRVHAEIDAIRQRADGERARAESLARTLDEVRSERDRLAMVTPPSRTTNARDELRHARLIKSRKLMRVQFAKLRKASDALKIRFEQADQVLSQRGELAQARDVIISEQRRQTAQRAGVRAAGAIFYLIGTVALVAALSWVSSGAVSPGKFAAKAVLTAQGRGRDLSEKEKADWAVATVELLDDPRFHEMAAERLGKRGIASLASPGAVSIYLSTHVSTQEINAGEIAIELRDVGRSRPQRILETVVSALASSANVSRQRRTDGATTAVRGDVELSRTSIDSTRVQTAGMYFVIGCGLVLAGGAAAWYKLSRAKSEFERNSGLASALDSTKWPGAEVGSRK